MVDLVLDESPREGPNYLTATLTAVAQELSTPGGVWVNVQLTGPFVGTVAFEQSNDGVTWVILPLNSAVNLSGVSNVGTATAPGMWHGPCSADFLRVRCSAFTSGAIGVHLSLSQIAISPLVMTVDTELPPAWPLADAAANPSSPIVGADVLLFNGTTWNRARDAAAAPVAGAGVQAVSSGTGALTSVPAGSSAVANGSAMNLGSAKRAHRLVVLTSAGVTGGAVQLQGSLDGANWFPLGAAVTTNAASTVFTVSVPDAPAIHVRADITTAIVGGTVTAWVASAG